MKQGTDFSILVIAYYFPPNSEVGGRRIARFCQYLPEYGIRPIVLTIDEESCETVDRSVRSSAQTQIVRARPADTILDWYHHWSNMRMHAQRAASGIRETGKVALERRSIVRRHLLSLLQFPDMRRGWYRPAIREAAKTLRKTSVAAVFSSGPPWTAHAIGYAISRRHNLPWIADFRDLWAADPWRNQTHGSERLPEWRNRLDLWVEDRWTQHAALIICTTRQQRDSLLRSHPHVHRNRIVIITNGSSDLPGDFTVSSHAKHGPRVLLHAGSLYGGRRIDAFCQAVASLVRTGRLSPDTTKIILMGEIDKDIEIGAKNSAPSLFRKGMISFRPRVDWEKAQEMLFLADVLLIFQGDNRTAIPAKFFEYMKTGKPILALGSEGALSDIILSTGSGFVADFDDQIGIESAIIQALQAEPRSTEEVRQLARKFDFRTLTAELAASIRGVLG
jgi:glycosyltransferase involved in cell wall biosynthesis